jgi:hypothetical protein
MDDGMDGRDAAGWMVRICNQPSIHTFPLLPQSIHPSTIHHPPFIHQQRPGDHAEPKPGPICRSTHNPDDPKGRRITLEIRVHTIRTTRAEYSQSLYERVIISTARAAIGPQGCQKSGPQTPPCCSRLVPHACDLFVVMLCPTSSQYKFQ